MAILYEKNLYKYCKLKHKKYIDKCRRWNYINKNTNTLEANNIKWPPDCVGIFHQPRRPKKTS